MNGRSPADAAEEEVGAGILPIDELWPELVVKKKLSSGASGQVFLVEEKATGDLYALKRVVFGPKDGPRYESTRLAARNEIKMYTTLYRHVPGLPAFYEWKMNDEHADLVMEYFAGGTLCDEVEALMHDDNMDEDAINSRIVEMFAAVVLQLACLHATGIVHCDLKPINILVRADGSVSIADLEQCEFVAEVRPNDDGICYIGGGTPGFRAPEVINEQDCSFELDVWALGPLLWAQQTRMQHPLFRSDDAVDFHVSQFKLRKAAGGGVEACLPEHVHVGDHHFTMPSAIRAFIARMVHPDPTQRPSTAELLLDPLLWPHVDTMLASLPEGFQLPRSLELTIRQHRANVALEAASASDLLLMAQRSQVVRLQYRQLSARRRAARVAAQAGEKAARTARHDGVDLEAVKEVLLQREAEWGQALSAQAQQLGAAAQAREQEVEHALHSMWSLVAAMEERCACLQREAHAAEQQRDGLAGQVVVLREEVRGLEARLLSAAPAGGRTAAELEQQLSSCQQEVQGLRALVAQRSAEEDTTRLRWQGLVAQLRLEVGAQHLEQQHAQQERLALQASVAELRRELQQARKAAEEADRARDLQRHFEASMQRAEEERRAQQLREHKQRWGEQHAGLLEVIAAETAKVRALQQQLQQQQQAPRALQPRAASATGVMTAPAPMAGEQATALSDGGAAASAVPTHKARHSRRGRGRKSKRPSNNGSGSSSSSNGGGAVGDATRVVVGARASGR